jgi:phosphoribosylamine--glycine ligase
VIHGLEELEDWRDGIVFHAGTAKRGGEWVTTGGRVLGVTALGATVGDAAKEAYRGVEKIGWEGAHFRRDIGHRAIGAR